jgi:hypothetical protein
MNFFDKDRQEIDTEVVLKTIEDLKKANKNINGNYDRMGGFAKEVSEKWVSMSGAVIMAYFQKLIDANEKRSDVFENYIKVLEGWVNPGYEYAEEVNTNLSDLFK